MLSRDGIAGLVVLAASVVLYFLTLGLKDNPLVPIGPGFYPRIVLGITGAFALLLVGADFLEHRRAPATKAGQAPARLNYRLVLLNFALFALYAGALPYLGFRLATFAYVVAAQALLEPPRDRKRWVTVIVIALVTTVVTYLVFERYLSVLLPRGRWTDF